MNFDRCSHVSNAPIIVTEENGRIFRIQNSGRKTVRKVTVDGCLINDRRIRCDYFFELVLTKEQVIYLELKGSDIEHAVEQLVATIGYCTARHKEHKKECHIVASRVPRAGAKVQNLQVMMAKRHETLLHVGTQQVEIKI